jgi:hypothetical protein
MGFWHAFFLAGTATFAAPVIIHLIFRARHERLVFPSLRFLRAALLRESRRLRLREALLLLLRALACVFFALAFARPYWDSALTAAGGPRAQQDLALLLDDSPSMGAVESANTRLSACLDQARKLCSECRDGDRLALVLVSEPERAEIELTGNFESLRKALQRPRPATRRGDLAKALRTALELFAGSSVSRRRVAVLSDFQATQVDRGQFAEIARAAATAPQPVSVEFCPPSERPARLPNLALTSIRALSDVWLEGRPVSFAVRVENFGSGEVPQAAVRLVSEGRLLAQRTVSLGPRGGTEIELAANFPRPGAAAGFAEVEGHDAFPDDDRRHFAFRLRDSLRVLLVEDEFRGEERFLDQSHFLRIALDPRPRSLDPDTAPPSSAPPASGDPHAGSYIRVQTAAAANLRAAHLEGVDLVFLVGVSSLPQPALTVLEDAVRGGRNLVIFMGRADSRAAGPLYETALWNNGEGLLPARAEGFFEGALLTHNFDGVDAWKTTHPIFEKFSGENEGELRRPKFFRHFRLRLEDLRGAGRPPGEVLATFNTGAPFLVERAYGKGRVLLFPFCPRPEATDLVRYKGVFVPLIHQVVRRLCGVDEGTRRGLYLLAGERINFSDYGIPAGSEPRVDFPAQGGDKENFSDLDGVTAHSLGVYTLTWKRGELKDLAYAAVALDPLESDLNPEDLSALRAPFASHIPEGDADREAPRKLDQQAREEALARQPEWRYFLVAALLCLLLEVLVRDLW